MPTSHFVDGGPGHMIEVGTFEGGGVTGQAWARCTCKWSHQHLFLEITISAAAAHARSMQAQAQTPQGTG